MNTTPKTIYVRMWDAPYNGGWVWYDRTLLRVVRAGWDRESRTVWWCVLGLCGKFQLQGWPFWRKS